MKRHGIIVSATAVHYQQPWLDLTPAAVDTVLTYSPCYQVGYPRYTNLFPYSQNMLVGMLVVFVNCFRYRQVAKKNKVELIET